MLGRNEGEVRTQWRGASYHTFAPLRACIRQMASCFLGVYCAVAPALRQRKGLCTTLNISSLRQPCSVNPTMSLRLPYESSFKNQRQASMTSSPHLSVEPLPGVSGQIVQPSCKNVVFFGETGVGKSSVINMLVGEGTDTSFVSSGAVGCTSGSVSYRTNIDGEDFVLWDTVGLNESENGSTPSLVATQKLAKLALELKDGLSLLVYVIRGTRFREVVRLNYEMFYRVICGGRVPIVVVVTGLENEEPMEAWWDANEADLRKFGLVFQDYACVTASRGRLLKSGGRAYEEEYELSKLKLRTLVVKNSSAAPVVLYHREGKKEPGQINEGLTRTKGRSWGGNSDERWQIEDQIEDPNGLEDTFLVFVWRQLCTWFAIVSRAAASGHSVISTKV